MNWVGKQRGAGWRFILASSVALFVLGSGAGCLSVLHPVHPPPPELCDLPKLLPCCCREHVYIFFVHGLDPLNYANLSGLREYCHSLGFTQTYYGQMYHGWTFAAEIRRIHREDPQARFVLVGFSAGANVVRSMANSLESDGILIDLIVYMGGNTLKNVPENRPANATKVVHILATGYIWKGYAIEGAENHKLGDAWHFGSPTHPHTLAVFAQELAVVASRVPVPATEPIPVPEQAGPTPRPVVPHTTHKPDEWDFLKPTTQLAPVGKPARYPPTDAVPAPVAKTETVSSAE